ncbi:MAG: UDP-N-acetylglucosamine 2-epimerase (non-hydrolyzing) [Eubacteriales bacterium]|nr:UDP-N-acetylglucosamine 2-epimerase (non-hydrolyzing) [Eubacteriales bacterium]
MKIMAVFGTRPEAIKMCPLVLELKTRQGVDMVVCVTGQHQEMLEDVLAKFHVVSDHNLDIMLPDQTLFDITTRILERIQSVLKEEKPDLVLVHGDTSTAFCAALACFYLHIPVGHVEAGLRTYDLDAPFPEEFNRQAVGLVANWHFAPTEAARQNLLAEGKKAESIYVTGNTGLDALRLILDDNYSHPVLEWAAGKKLVLLTAHRRENSGEPFIHIFKAVRRLTERFSDICVIYPMHMNPKIRKLAREILGGNPQVKLLEPLNPYDFQNIMAHSALVLTDSGGIQEEAPALGKPVLVMRDTTERPEGVEAGTLKLTGTSEEEIYCAASALLSDEAVYEKMAHAVNPYGDGYASHRIADILCVNMEDRVCNKSGSDSKTLAYNQKRT